MIIDVLSAGPTFRQSAYAVVFPGAGVLLLVFGIRRRLAWRRWNHSDNDRLLHSAGAHTAPRIRCRPSTAGRPLGSTFPAGKRHRVLD